MNSRKWADGMGSRKKRGLEGNTEMREVTAAGIVERWKGPGATRERTKRGINETAGKGGGTTRLVLSSFCFNPLVLSFSSVTIPFCQSVSFDFTSLFVLIHFLKSCSKALFFFSIIVSSIPSC